MSIKKNNEPEPGNAASLTEDIYTYPPADDIYNKLEEAEEVDPENITKGKLPNVQYETDAQTGKVYVDNGPGNDLDVPGSELDDELEITGGEDEENNYYSLGHDNHDKFDEREGSEFSFTMSFHKTNEQVAEDSGFAQLEEGIKNIKVLFGMITKV